MFVEKWGMGCKTNRVGGVPATSTWLWGWHTQHYVAQHLSNSSLRIGRPVASPKAQPATLSVFLVEQSGHFSSSQVAVNWYFGLVVRGGLNRVSCRGQIKKPPLTTKPPTTQREPEVLSEQALSNRPAPNFPAPCEKQGHFTSVRVDVADMGTRK